MSRDRVNRLDKWGGFSEGKIKGVAQNGLKPLSAHHFFWPMQNIAGTRIRRNPPCHLRKVPGHDLKRAIFRNLSLFRECGFWS